MDKDVSAGSNTTTLGYLLLGVTLLAFGLGHTDVIDGVSAANALDLAMWAGGLGLFVTGLLEFRAGSNATGTAFAGLGALWFTWSAAADSGASANAAGLFSLLFALVALSLALASSGSGLLTQAVYGFLFLSMLLLAIGSFADNTDLAKVGGWAAAVSGAAAWYTATAAMAHLPTSMPRRAAHRETAAA
ncbi:GPR1/FUN34/YaaH family transporter [Streptomyces sp. NPDC051940]|uniref:GPR1/FUN34/YaaH family transporter n=1 Tax=Streptomyces sp. NPDC051940 TaxID=3155675 RepID=UPI00343F196F